MDNSLRAGHPNLGNRAAVSVQLTWGRIRAVSGHLRRLPHRAGQVHAQPESAAGPEPGKSAQGSRNICRGGNLQYILTILI